MRLHVVGTSIHYVISIEKAKYKYQLVPFYNTLFILILLHLYQFNDTHNHEIAKAQRDMNKLLLLLESSNTVMFFNTLLCATNTINECSNVHAIALIIQHVIKLVMYAHKITFTLAY